MFGAGDGSTQAEYALGVANPLVAVGPLLGVLSVGEDRLEGTSEVRVPVIVAGLGVDELVDWTHVRPAGRKFRMDSGDVPPSPSADSLVGVTGHNVRNSRALRTSQLSRSAVQISAAAGPYTTLHGWGQLAVLLLASSTEA